MTPLYTIISGEGSEHSQGIPELRDPRAPLKGGYNNALQLSVVKGQTF